MRLLDVNTLEVKEFFESSVPTYAILSHTWAAEEVTFSDLLTKDWKSFVNVRSAVKKKKGWVKIEFACRQAQKDGVSFVWADTCCIDKSSSSELSEAINSMHRWYQNALVCYVYLADIDAVALETAPISSSRWFTRGWTLQELLAPKNVRFFDKQWRFLGTKAEHEQNSALTEMLSKRTNIDADVLNGKVDLHTQSVACRMSWASARQTTRTEDIAYCLLGIFDINMPLLYGEGTKAFSRLQAEILKELHDHSVLAWDFNVKALFVHEGSKFNDSDDVQGQSPLASSPQQFEHCKSIIRTPPTSFDQFGLNSTESWTITSGELRTRLPLLEVAQETIGGCKVTTYIAIIGCMSRIYPLHNMGILVSSFHVTDIRNIPRLIVAGAVPEQTTSALYRRAMSNTYTSSTVLVPLSFARRARLQDVHLKAYDNIFTDAEMSHLELHAFVLLKLSDRARSNGLASPVVLKPSSARVTEPVNDLNDPRSGVEYEISWTGSWHEELQIYFDLLHDETTLSSFTIKTMDDEMQILANKPEPGSDAVDGIIAGMSGERYPLGETTFVLGAFICTLKQDVATVFNQAYRLIDVDLKPS